MTVLLFERPTMPRDDRPYITVVETMPTHPKVAGLSDKAFRLLLETWCWCSLHKTDGHVLEPLWRKAGPTQARQELVTAGLMDDDLAGGVIVHDWDMHQRTAEEVRDFKDAKKKAGELGNHNRWHEGKNKKFDPKCPICLANRSQDVSHLR